MSKLFRILFTLIIFSLWSVQAISQKNYKYKISIPTELINQKDFKLNFYDGYRISHIPIDSCETITGEITSLLNYPVLEIFFFTSKNEPVTLSFFLKREVIELTVDYNLHDDSITVKFSKGLLNFNDAGKDKFELFAKKELTELNAYSKKHNYDFSNVSPTELKLYEKYFEIVNIKVLEFIKLNPTLLYNIRLFTNRIIRDPSYSFEFLNSFYQKYLNPTFKNTFEGKYILEKLDQNRLNLNTKAPLLNIPFNDLKGNTHSFETFENKIIIVNIWATWCVPCVAEIPQLKNLYSKYKNKLEIISFSADTDSLKLKKFLIENKIEWVNVENRFDFCNAFGLDKGIPQLFLIDKNGFIIYSRNALQDFDLKILEKILEKILND